MKHPFCDLEQVPFSPPRCAKDAQASRESPGGLLGILNISRLNSKPSSFNLTRRNARSRLNLSDVRTGRAFKGGEHHARLQSCCACVLLQALVHASLNIAGAGQRLIHRVRACWVCESLRLLVLICLGFLILTAAALTSAHTKKLT